MNSLIFTALVLVIALFHGRMRRFMRQGSVKTAFCAIWCIDAIFAVCGTVISFMLYGYGFAPFFTVRNGILILLYVMLTAVFILITPSGFAMLKRKKLEEEEVLTAQFRLNDTLGIVRNWFLALLFFLPVLFALVQKKELAYLAAWKETDICGGFCFVAFLVLVPLCLRQACFWLRNLADGEKMEKRLLNKYRRRLQYRHKNRRL